MSEDGTKPRSRWFPRFSLRTLLLFVLLCASGFGLWWRWAPWVIVQRLGGHAAPITDAAYSPDGSLMLTLSCIDNSNNPKNPYTIETIVWEAHTGTRLTHIQFQERAPGVDYARFSDDGRWVIVGYWNFDSFQAIFETRTGKPLLPDSLNDPPSALCFSRDSSRLLVEYGNRAPELWEPIKRERLLVFESLDQGVVHGSFSLDGTRIAFAFHQNGKPMVAVFDTSNGRRIVTLDMYLKWPLALTPDGRSLIATLDKPVEAFSNTQIEEAFESSIHPPEQRTCRVNLETGKAERVIGDKLAFDPFLPGGQSLLFNCDFYSAVRDANTLDLKCWMAGTPGIARPEAVGGERILVRPATPTHLVGPSNVCFEEWDIKKGQRLYRIAWPTAAADTAETVYIKEGRRIFVTTASESMVWDSGTGANRIEFPATGFPSPDGRRVLLWEDGKDLRIGDLDYNKTLAVLEGTAADRAPNASFAPSGERMLLVPRRSADEAQVWERRRDEGPWGIVALPEFWLTVIFALLLVWSLVRDFRTLRKAAT